MDRKPLIGICICVVVLLLLTSLSNVVGYQSVNSTTICDSPLFNIRTTRAFNSQNERSLTSDYLGKGMNTLSFPSKGINIERLQELIERIQSMSDTTFNNFITMVIHQKNHDPTLKSLDSHHLIALLNKVRNNQDVQTNQESALHVNANVSTTALYGIILCFIDTILVAIVGVLLLLYIQIKSIFQGTNCFHSFMTGCEDCPEFQGQVFRYLYKQDRT